MNFVTFENMNDCIYKNLNKIPRDIDLVVGIPRSGMLPANIIALYLNLPFTDIDSFLDNRKLKVGNTRKCKNWITMPQQAQKVLVVDDSISSGKAIRDVKKQIKEYNISSKCVFLAVYALETNIMMVDIFLEICHHPRMFEWNYMHHWGLEYSCVDIDGVLCEDPTFIQNDDGRRYAEFLENATPKIIPTKKINTLVTCRLEKYRKETEDWLNKQGVMYDNLVMLSETNSRERALNIDHGKYKGEVYKKSPCILFIESDYEQAIRICEVSKKEVFCVANRKLITPDNFMAHVKILESNWKITAKRVVKKILKKL